MLPEQSRQSTGKCRRETMGQPRAPTHICVAVASCRPCLHSIAPIRLHLRRHAQHHAASSLQHHAGPPAPASTYGASRRTVASAARRPACVASHRRFNAARIRLHNLARHHCAALHAPHYTRRIIRKKHQEVNLKLRATNYYFQTPQSS